MRQSSTLAVSALVLGVLGLGFAIWVGLGVLSEARDRQAGLNLGAVPAPQDVLLEGDSPARIAQSLLEHTRASASRAGLSITSVEVRPALDDADPHAVLITAEAEYGAILEFLHRIESGPPAVRITQAQLSRSEENAQRLVLEATLEAWGGRGGAR